MKTIIKLALVAVIFITYSCDKESAALSDELSPVALKGGKDVERPISITLSGMDDPDGGLGTITGKMTHLGKINGTVAPGSVVLDPETGGFTFSTIDQCDADDPELDVVNAANGDKIFSRGDLIFKPADIGIFNYSGTITFCGGTGRFEGATGSMHIADGVYIITGTSNYDPEVFIGVFSHTGNGYITY